MLVQVRWALKQLTWEVLSDMEELQVLSHEVCSWIFWMAAEIQEDQQGFDFRCLHLFSFGWRFEWQLGLERS